MSVTYNSSCLELDLKLESKETVEKEDYFFEGAEKLLEIWFAKEDESDNGGSLRKIPRDEIDKMLNISGCRVLDARSNDQMDSYVLSESSLFVSDNRMILKTCGSTRLLDAIPHILSLAKRHGGFEIVSNVYYSRKNFIRPQLQPDPHKSFNDEVGYLQNIFPSGEAYCLGPMNSADCWYLFAMSSARSAPADHTLEIQMTELPPEVLKLYGQASFSSGRACTRASGIIDLNPFGTIIHEELFEPVGYSMNGLVANTDQYVTVHVTPEPQFAYVSFETNQRRKCLYKQTLKVLECFKPRKFIMTLFTNNESHNGKSSQQLLWNREIPNYQRVSLQFVRLAHDDNLVYAQFVQVPNGKIRRKVSRIPCSDDDEDSNGSSD